MPIGPTGRGWTTALDFDFTAQGSQSLSPDGTYTVGGMQWIKHNSANDSVAMAVTAGTGLVVQPVSATDYTGSTRTLPTLWLPFSQIANLDQLEWNSSIRLWVHVSAENPAAAFDDALIAIDSNTLGAMTYQMQRGVTANSTISMAGQHQINGTVITTGTFTQGNVFVLGATNNVMVLDIPHLAGAAFKTLHGQWDQGGSGSWPDPTALAINTMGISNAGSYNMFLPAAIPLNSLAQLFGITLGAKRAGSATALSVTYAHVRLDYKN